MIAACSDPPTSRTELSLLAAEETSPGVPYSSNHDIVLVEEDLACGIDSYATRVFCMRPGHGPSQTWGREGEGPGEFRTISGLARGPDTTVLVRDARLGRISMFSTTGDHLQSFAVPRAWRILEADADGLRGYLSPALLVRDTFTASIYSIDWQGMPSSDTVMLRFPSAVPMPPGSPVPAFVQMPGGTTVAWSGDYNLLVFDAQGTMTGTFTSPEYRPELPNWRDREEAAAVYQAVFREPVPQAKADSQAALPKAALVAGTPLRADEEGRLWVATTADRDSVSWLDLFSDGRYLGSVAVRDRLLAYDVLGHTLVALVERRDRDAAGIPRRELDWYHVR